jgi:O-antigen ligase
VSTRRASPLLLVPAALAALAVVAFAASAARGGGDVHAFSRAALVLVAVPALAIAATARPAWLLGIALALAMFNSHWGTLHAGAPVDRVFVGFAIVVTLARTWHERGGLRTRPMDWLLMLVALYAVVSTIVAGSLDDSQARFALADRFGLVPFLLFYAAGYAFREERDRNILLGVMVAMGAYLGLVALFETIPVRSLVIPHYINNKNLGIHFGRARGPFLEATANGLVLYACAVASAVGLATWRNRRARWIALAVCVLCALGVLFTLTRGAWLAAGIGTVVALLYAPRTRRWALPVFGVGALIVVVAFAVSPSLHRRANDRADDKKPLWDRENSNAAALRMINTRPVLGYGWGRFSEASPDFYRESQTYPLSIVKDVHNVYLANAVELGLLGAGLWLFALLAALAGGIFRRGPPSLQPWRVGLLAIALSYLAAGFITPLGFALPTYLLWTWAGVTWSDRR